MSLKFPTDTLEKTVLAALDKFVIADSEDGNELKDLTYADLRTNLLFVDGPSSSVTNNIATFNGITGKIIKDSGYKLDDAGINATSLWSAFQIIAQLALKVTGSNSQLPTQGENDALVGAGGTVGSANLYETQYDTSNASTKTATTISFTASTKTIADSGNGFVTAGFKQGTQFTITGSASNNGTFTIVSVAAGAIVVTETVVNESAGATVVMTTLTADKLLRLDSNSKIPAVDGTQLLGISVKSKSFTASGNIALGDCVYSSASNTAKTLYPSAMGTGASISTAPGHILSPKAIPLSTNGYYLHLGGGTVAVSGILYAQVRTINSGETDVTNGAGGEATVYSTGNGVRHYDICQIGTDKFLVIFIADTAGAAAGIKTVILTVSGTTVTVGAVTTIESTGGFTQYPSCAKVDTDKGIIFYVKDSDGDLYSQVLSVSGTTISTNTPVLVKVCSNTQIKATAQQLTTNSVAVIYLDGSGTVYGRTVSISGTTPTINAEQTITTVSSTPVAWGSAFVSSTKIVFYESDNSPVNDTIYNIAISGATMTISSGLAIGSSRNSYWFGISVIGTSYLLLMHNTSSTVNTLRLLDISGTAPTSISTQTLSTSAVALNGHFVVKVLPWTYIVSGHIADSDFIVKLTPVSSARVGVAESAISNGATGSIALRFQKATLSALTAGSKYYFDETGQLTVNSSITAPEAGIAMSSTELLLT